MKRKDKHMPTPPPNPNLPATFTLGPLTPALLILALILILKFLKLLPEDDNSATVAAIMASSLAFAPSRQIEAQRILVALQNGTAVVTA